jgi:ribosomal protein S18 acetylase RimI-like enzyme
MNFTIDYPDADEFKFILDSWSNSFRKSPYAGCVPNNLWPSVSRSTITQLIARPSTEVKCALSPTSEGERGRVMGYFVAEPGVLHWLYVKKDFRRLGIGTKLLAEATKNWRGCHQTSPRYTHKTGSSQRFLPPGWKWDVIPARVKG